MPRVMISCGEPSGDLYAGALVRALRDLDPSVEAFGFGGAKMAEAGATLVGDYRGFSVTGLVEALAVLPRSWRMLRTLGAAARQRTPDVFVAIDFPDFNFRLLPILRGLGVPIVYYISPQLWAWRAGRLDTIKRYVDRMLVIFPFERGIYEKAHVPVEFVGHPLIELMQPAPPREAFLAEHHLDASRPVLALLPGSRPNELRHILPTMVEAARVAASRIPGLQCAVARAPSLDDALFAPARALAASGVPVAIVPNAADGVLASSDAVVTASGTATVQTALHGKPMVVVYRLAPLSYTMMRRFVRVSTYGMVNLVAGRTIVRELIQDAFTPPAVADEIVSLLTDSARARRMKEDLAEVREKLGGPGASRRAAESVFGAMRR